MRSALVIVAAWLTMACGAAPDGALEAPLTLADLDADERAMIDERFGAEFAEARLNRRAAESLFSFARCDLNDVAPPELIAFGRGAGVCGPDGRDCGVWALGFAPAGWVELLETTGTPRLASSATNGWRDLVIERGGPPEVFKFDGAAYVAETGAIDIAPDALTPWDAEVDAQGLAQKSDIVWFTFEDDLPEEAENVFLWFYVNRVLEGDGAMRALPADFRIGLAELDNAAPAEVILRGVSLAFCSAEGCRYWIFRPEKDGAPAEIAGFEGFELQVAASGASGHRDLIVTGREGLEVWRDEGAGYARRMPGDGPGSVGRPKP